jgi:uncharacterized protein (TIGR02594 family)
MRTFETSAYKVAGSFFGTSEVAGNLDNPLILAMLKMDQNWPTHDEVAWCSAFVNFVAKILGLPRSKDLRARSWLAIGTPIDPAEAEIGSDVIVIKRGQGEQPGPEVIDAPGHVGFFGGYEDDKVIIRAGNQGNSVNDSRFPKDSILGIRRLY